MHELPNDISEDLLARYFAGDVSTAEADAIKRWRDADPDHASLLEQYHVLWVDLGSFKKDAKPTKPLQLDVDVAWSKHKSNRNNPVTTALPSSFTKVIWMALAAMLVVCFGVGWLVLSWEKNAQQFVAADETQKTVDLPDGSVVELNTNSTISYPEKFAGNSRYVKMTGEAFFEVEPDAKKPFTIELGEAHITVLGTSFNVEASATLDTVAVVVETGKVKLVYQDQHLVLMAGQKGVLYKKTKTLELNENPTSGIDQFWRTRTLTFRGEKLPEIIQTISEAYHEQIDLASSELASCSLDVSFENDSFENVVEVIAMTLNLEVDRQGNRTILNGSGCDSDQP